MKNFNRIFVIQVKNLVVIFYHKPFISVLKFSAEVWEPGKELNGFSKYLVQLDRIFFTTQALIPVVKNLDSISNSFSCPNYSLSHVVTNSSACSLVR